ncbi:MAG: type II secretion system protein [Oscillatoriophycideae cyanobacterium NC_groundwater_1537_Pr4_S-0.65um_50_18]|nr:type II secretion system protein [Oscillatoriophycideae cyanobacterium NC_groundwater_1537_Pr4_S-0.65um_50_18]
MNINLISSIRQVSQRHWKPARPISTSSLQSGFSSSGFTIADLLTVMTIAGILAAIAAPSWLSFHRDRALSSSQDEVFQAIRQTQAEAQRSHANWQVSFRESDSAVEWAMHPLTEQPRLWQPLLKEVRLDPAQTTLARDGNLYRLQFSNRGRINGQLGRITLKTSDGSLRRCVFASTLLGTLRKAADRDCE